MTTVASPADSLQKNNGAGDLGSFGWLNPDGTTDLQPPTTAANTTGWALRAVRNTSGFVTTLQSSDIGAGEVLSVGFGLTGVGGGYNVNDEAYKEIYFGAKRYLSGLLTDLATVIDGDYQGYVLQQKASPDTDLVEFYITQHTNFAIAGRRQYPTVSDYGGGRSVMFWGAANVVPDEGSPPTNGIALWVDPSTFDLTYRRPNGDTAVIESPAVIPAGQPGMLIALGTDPDLDPLQVVGWIETGDFATDSGSTPSYETARTLDLSTIEDGTYRFKASAVGDAGVSGDLVSGFVISFEQIISIRDNAIVNASAAQNKSAVFIPDDTDAPNVDFQLSAVAEETEIRFEVRGEADCKIDWQVTANIEQVKAVSGGSGLPRTWTPAIYGADLLSWIDPAVNVVTSSGDTVLDSIGNRVSGDTNKDLTPAGGTVTYHPTGLNGRPTISAASAARLIPGGAWGTAPSGKHTIMGVMKMISGCAWGGDTGKDNRCQTLTGGSLNAYAGSAFVSSGSDDTTTFHAVAIVYDPSGSERIYIDDATTPVATGSAGSEILDRICLFDIFAGGAAGYGDIAEHLVVAGDDATERENAFAYFTTKFAL